MTTRFKPTDTLYMVKLVGNADGTIDFDDEGPMTFSDRDTADRAAREEQADGVTCPIVIYELTPVMVLRAQES